MLLPILFALLTNAVQLSEALQKESVGESFALDGLVASETFANDEDFAARDASGSVIVLPPSRAELPKAGSHILIRGVVEQSLFGHSIAVSKSFRTISTGTPIPVRTASLRDIQSGACDASVVRTSGMLRDYFADEIDPTYLFLILNDDGVTVYVAATCHSQEDANWLETLIGHNLTVTGLCDPHPSGNRRKIGRLIRINALSSVHANAQKPTDPFDVPSLDLFTTLQPAQFHTLGRRRIRGRVTAVWGKHSLLLSSSSRKISRVDLAKDEPPTPGDIIEAVGFPETDLYRINFSRAIWRHLATPSLPQESATNITAVALMTDYEQKTAINAEFHGQVIRITGIVRSLPSIGPENGRFYLESDGYTLPIDISAYPSLAEKLEIGSVIGVTGVCVTDIENWRPNLVFPHIKEILIVTRGPDDITVLRRPSWWTPARLMIVIGSLLAVLIGILIWNRALKALAEKRGKALANEELDRLESDLKVCERTRLAVELHDSIAQNLTGVSMEIDTALRGEEPLPESAAQHMGRALRTIDSCRGELRNCLWDLRSQALEEDDMNKAIRLTLSQTIGKADLTVRFNVPRSRFTDNTAHTLLRIIRELAANAVRHGHATEIKIAGSIEDNILKFSVRDNGCGFDPDACPGVIDGHFGLQGVRERVASFEGNVQIESAPGKGTRVSVSINAPQTDDKEKI